ncbi:Oligosaccharide translocation protein rft1 [Tulasnella sp. 419]|nr:Oligosaccharide translocation protein rft1 [Tulasnella sp. 419]
MTNNDLLSSSLASASSLVLLQLLSRATTFILNQSLVRLSTPQAFGTATIQFELLLSTILFLAREGVRNALLRSSSDKQSGGNMAQDESITNISLLPPLLGVPIAALASIFYLRTSSHSARSQPLFFESVVVYSISAVLELLAEPYHILAQNQLNFRVRVRAEGTAVIVKSVITLLVLVKGGPHMALLSFALGQAGCSLTILVTYLAAYGLGSIRLIPRKMVKKVHGRIQSYRFDPQLLHLSFAMTAQSVVKHFLTEGDKIVISRISTLEDQGGYAIASNYGSLVARIIFQPLEETSRLFFSKTLVTPSPKVSDATRSPKSDGSQVKDVSSQLVSATTILHTLLLFHTHLSLLLWTFVPPYLPTLLSILLPRNYANTSAPQILLTYLTFYLPTMAYNGIIEAFHSSTASPNDLSRQSKFMGFFSVTYVLATWIFVEKFGWREDGLIYANVLNLGLRALYGWIFARKYMKERTVNAKANVAGSEVRTSEILPPAGVFVVFGIAGWVTRMTGVEATAGWKEKGQHVCIGIACVSVCLGVCWILERKTFKQTISVLRKSKTS